MRNSDEIELAMVQRSGAFVKYYRRRPQRLSGAVGLGHRELRGWDDLCVDVAHNFLESVNLMSKNTRIPSTPPLFPRKPEVEQSGAPDAASAPTTAEHEPIPLPEDVPVLHSLGIVKVKRNGWVIVRTFSEGDKIVSKEVMSEPSALQHALEYFKIACVRTYFPDVVAGKTEI